MGDLVWKVLIVLVVIAVAVEGLILAGTLREIGGILLQVGPPRPGDVGEGPARGTKVDLDSLSAGRPSVLMFLSPQCSLCKPIIDALPVVQRSFPRIQWVALVVNGSEDERAAYGRGLPVPLGSDGQSLFDSWALPGTPYAVALDTVGQVVRGGIVNSLPQLETLAEGVADIGELMPETGTLIDLAAVTVEAGDLNAS